MSNETYIFRDCETKEQVRVEWSYDQLMENQDCTRKATINGRLCYRDVEAEIKGDEKWVKNRPQRKMAKWPIESDGLGVAPSQAQDLRDHLKAHGLGHVDVNDEGNPILTGPKMKRAVSKASGMEPLDEFTI